jgi:hypothetical protein
VRAEWDRWLLAIIGLALAARVVAVQIVPVDLLAWPWEYEEVALSLLSGNGFLAHYHGVPYLALVHPFYPVMCAAVYGVVGHSSLLAMQVVQSLAVIPAAWLAFQLGSDLAGRWGGRLAAAGVALHPALLVFSLRRHPLWFDAILFLAALLATYRLRSRPTTRQLALLGLLFGVGMLSRSTVGAFMAIACVWLAWRWRLPLSETAARAGVVVGVALLVIAPWLVRNAVIFQRPVGFVSTDGQNLWIGNNPLATGGALTVDGRAVVDADPAIAAARQGRSETEQQAIYRRAALEYIAGHPGTTVANYGRKLGSFLFWSTQTGAWYPARFRTPYLTFYVILLAAALVGSYRLLRAGHMDAVVLCAAFFLGIGLLQSVFYVEGRHRWSVESALIVLAAAGTVSLWASRRAAASSR